VHIGKEVHLSDYPTMNDCVADLRNQMIVQKEQYEEKRKQGSLD